MSNALATVEPTNTRFLAPAASIEKAIERYAIVQAFTQRVMRPEVDFGKIPGTAKDTLLKPGAEKLCSLFGLAPTFDPIESIIDERDGETFILYRYRCTLWAGDLKAGEGIGSCNSFEKKYRYRSAERTCPNCGKPTIITGKKEYGGGFICFAKKGGCGSKFADGDPKITGQELGQVKNPDPLESLNTIDKMAQKRALIAAVLIATNASEYFTQDMEDFSDYIPGEFHEVTGSGATGNPDPAPQAPKNGNGKPAGNSKPAMTLQDALARKVKIEGKEYVMGDMNEKQIKWLLSVAKGDDLTAADLIMARIAKLPNPPEVMSPSEITTDDGLRAPLRD